MRNRRSDTVVAVSLSAAFHAGLIGLMLVAMWWSRQSAPMDAAGGMRADVVDVGQLSAAMQRTLATRPAAEPPVPEPLPEPVQPPAPQPTPQQVLPAPDTQEQDAVVDAPTPLKTDATRVQDEKHRQAQADTAAAAQSPQQAASDAVAQAQQKAQAERAAQLAQIRKNRAAAGQEARAAAERLTELEAARGGGAAEESARADASASGAGNDDDLRGRYAAALRDAITSKWTRPDSIPAGAPCRLVIRQLAGGKVVDAQVAAPCSYDEAGRRSIEAAVLKAQPLPYAGFESVFDRTLLLNFRAP